MHAHLNWRLTRILKIPVSTPDYSTVIFSDGSSLIFDATEDEIRDLGSDGQILRRASIDGTGTSFRDFSGVVRISGAELRVIRGLSGLLKFKNSREEILTVSLSPAISDEKGKPWLLVGAQMDAIPEGEMLFQKIMIGLELAMREDSRGALP